MQQFGKLGLVDGIEEVSEAADGGDFLMPRAVMTCWAWGDRVEEMVSVVMTGKCSP